MSIFQDTIIALTDTVAPVHQAVGRAHSALSQATSHLTEALEHLGRDYDRAMTDKSISEASLADANRRVDELKTAALHLATVGDGIEKLIGAAQTASTSPADAVAAIPQDIEEVQSVITNAEAVVADTQAAVAPAGEPAAHE